MLDDAAITRLEERLAGAVLRPADACFARARAEAVFNGAVRRQPRLIVRPASTDDVVRAIAWTREHGADLTCAAAGTAGRAPPWPRAR